MDTRGRTVEGAVTKMKVVRTVTAMSRLAAGWKGRVVLVPTMGALHAGHLALVDHARRIAGGGTVVVSIFVNPLQFGPKEDLARYPRPLRRDLALCRERGEWTLSSTRTRRGCTPRGAP